MKINHNQKRTLLAGIILIVIALLVWAGYGGEIFTKTQILIEKKDEFLDSSYKEWKDQFVLGFDYTMGFIGSVIVIVSIIMFKQRSNSKKSE